MENLIELLPRLLASFDEHERFTRASLAGAALEVRRRDRDRRFGEPRGAVEGVAVAASLSPEAARALRAVVRLLVSSEIWRSLKDESGLDGEQSGRLVAWLLGLVFAELDENPRSLEETT